MRATGRAFAAFVVGACLSASLAFWAIFLVPKQWLPHDESGLQTIALFCGPAFLVGGTGFAAWVLARERRGHSTERPIMIAAAGIALLTVTMCTGRG